MVYLSVGYKELRKLKIFRKNTLHNNTYGVDTKEKKLKECFKFY